MLEDHEQSSNGVPQGAGENPWRFKFPNTADFNFNYWKLLNDAEVAGNAIAQARKPEQRIAIIGAGVAGLTAARELFRSGYKNIDIYEHTVGLRRDVMSSTFLLPGIRTTAASRRLETSEPRT